MSSATLRKPKAPAAEHHIIGGHEVASVSGETLDVVAPGNGDVFASIAAGGAQDVDSAVAAELDAQQRRILTLAERLLASAARGTGAAPPPRLGSPVRRGWR